MKIDNIFKEAAKRQASDVHLVFGQPPVLRIDGSLVAAPELLSNHQTVTEEDLREALETMLSEKEIKRLYEDRDLDLSYQIAENRFRVNCAFEKGQIMISARIIKDHEPTLEELGFPPVVKKLLDLPQGFILLTGPTGCGKSTSLAAMINYLNNHYAKNIITLEDPIEYVFKSKKSLVTQRQLGTDVLSFASGLKHILRQDPNVIMLGEMRDPETIAAAVTLAETGHLVLATLHTHSAAQTIDRIIDSFPPHQQAQIKSQLSFVLSAVISQRLLLRKSGGRIAAREILINNPAVANLIREGKLAQIKSTIETSSSLGMITMDRQIKELYQAGEIERQEAEKYLEEKDYLPS